MQHINRKLTVILCSISLMMLSITAFGITPQPLVKDSASVKKDTCKCQYPCPRTAARLAAILPGAGQIYNKKYWKLPIVYGALGALTYLTIDYSIKFNTYKKGYLTAVDSIRGNETFKDTITYTAQRLNAEQEQAHSRRDLFALVGVVFYLATVVDALVDAHLAHFDVSNNLSMQIKPNVQPYYNFAHNGTPTLGVNAGVTLNFNIHSKKK